MTTLSLKHILARLLNKHVARVSQLGLHHPKCNEAMHLVFQLFAVIPDISCAPTHKKNLGGWGQEIRVANVVHHNDRFVDQGSDDLYTFSLHGWNVDELLLLLVDVPFETRLLLHLRHDAAPSQRSSLNQRYRTGSHFVHTFHLFERQRIDALAELRLS
jgi:hypothetical protein